MATTNRDIKYINRDFSDFRSRLIEYARTYFPSTYNDFSENSPGMMFMEQASYVGDVLSFYLDNQFQETFTQYYDTYKGDVIRVGYLASRSEQVAKLCKEDLNVESISEKEYNEAIKELRLAPVPAA